MEKVKFADLLPVYELTRSWCAQFERCEKCPCALHTDESIPCSLAKTLFEYDHNVMKFDLEERSLDPEECAWCKVLRES